MLDEQMAGAHLVRLVGSSAGRVGRVEELGTGKRADRVLGVALRNLPCGLLRDGVVEVRQTTRVAEPDFPLRLLTARQTNRQHNYFGASASLDRWGTYRHGACMKGLLDRV